MKLIIVGLLILGASGLTPVDAMPSPSGTGNRVFLYLDIPADNGPDVSLHIERIELIGPGRPLPLELEEDSLNARELAGSRILLTETILPAGDYDALHVTFHSISGRVGVAPVTVAHPEDGVQVPLGNSVSGEQSTALFLTWHPTPIDSETRSYTPAFRMQPGRVPPHGRIAFVSSPTAGAISLVDRTTGRVEGLLPVGNGPEGIIHSAREQRVYVALAGDDAVAVIDALSLQTMRTVPLQFGDEPFRLLLSRDETTLYVLNRGSRTLVGLTTWSLQERFRFAVAEDPRDLVADPVSGKVFVASRGEGIVHVFDPAGSSATGTISGIPAPTHLALAAEERLLLVAGVGQHRLHLLNLDTHEISGRMGLCAPAGGMAHSTLSRRLFVAVPACDQIGIYNPELGLEFPALDLPGRPGRITFSGDRRHLLVVLPDQGQVAICDPDRGRVELLVPVGGSPCEVVAP